MKIQKDPKTNLGLLLDTFNACHRSADCLPDAVQLNRAFQKRANCNHAEAARTIRCALDLGELHFTREFKLSHPSNRLC